MKRLFFIALLAAATTAACGTTAQPAPEPTTEVRAEATPEVTAASSANPAWVTVTRTQPDYPGWEYQHPDGWDVVTLDPNNIFLYSTPGAGDHLFATGLEPGEMVFQISLNHVDNPQETPESHLGVLTGTLEMTFSAPQPVTIAGLDGVQQTGVSDELNMTVLASSRQFLPGTFIDIFAYSRSDELDANLPTINAVIETIHYALATE